MGKENAVYVSELGFSFEEEAVFRNITFGIECEDILCVVGASGAGKTTLLRTIAGILYEDNGTVYMNGMDMKEVPSHKRKISFVFQKPNLYPHLTIYQNMDMGIKAPTKDVMSRHKKVTEMMQKFGLMRYANLKPKHLSVGEQQKVALAKSLVSEDELYLLDEPLCSIDPEGRQRILELMKEIQIEKRKPFIFVSHNGDDIRKLASKVLVLGEDAAAEGGSVILQFGSVEEVFTNPKNKMVAQLLGINT